MLLCKCLLAINLCPLSINFLFCSFLDEEEKTALHNYSFFNHFFFLPLFFPPFDRKGATDRRRHNYETGKRCIAGKEVKDERKNSKERSNDR